MEQNSVCCAGLQVSNMREKENVHHHPCLRGGSWTPPPHPHKNLLLFHCLPPAQALLRGSSRRQKRQRAATLAS